MSLHLRSLVASTRVVLDVAEQVASRIDRLGHFVDPRAAYAEDLEAAATALARAAEILERARAKVLSWRLP